VKTRVANVIQTVPNDGGEGCYKALPMAFRGLGALD
jgi:hypothetical protein